MTLKLNINQKVIIKQLGHMTVNVLHFFVSLNKKGHTATSNFDVITDAIDNSVSFYCTISHIPFSVNLFVICIYHQKLSQKYRGPNHW